MKTYKAYYDNSLCWVQNMQYERKEISLEKFEAFKKKSDMKYLVKEVGTLGGIIKVYDYYFTSKSCLGVVQ